MGYVVEVEEIVRHLIKVTEAFLYGRDLPHALQNACRRIHNALFDEIEVYLDVHASGRIVGNVVRVRDIETVLKLLDEHISDLIELRLVHEDIDITARAHPRLSVVATHYSALKRQELNTRLLKCLAQLFVLIFYLLMTVDRGEYMLLPRCAWDTVFL